MLVYHEVRTHGPSKIKHFWLTNALLLMHKFDFHQKLGSDHVFYKNGLSGQNRLQPLRLDDGFRHTQKIRTTDECNFEVFCFLKFSNLFFQTDRFNISSKKTFVFSGFD